MRYFLVLSLVACALAPGVGHALPPPTASPAPDKTTARLEELESKVARLEHKLWQLENGEKSVTLDPADLPSGSQRIQTTTGDFLLSLKDVEPYLDGVRVTLEIGNPSTADYRGLTLDVQWGERPPEDLDAWMKWYENLKKKSFALTDTLSAGAWNRVTFVLSPAPPSLFGHLEISMSTGAVALASKAGD